MRSHRALTVCLIAVFALGFASVAASKEVRTTTCGKNHCRTVTNGISGIATLPGRIPAPRTGDFYTVELRGSYGWKVVYEARRQIVQAADLRGSSFLGPHWARLTSDVRPHFAKAVRGLEPMRSAPPHGD